MYLAKWLFVIVIPAVSISSFLVLMLAPMFHDALYGNTGQLFVMFGVAYACLLLMLIVLSVPLRDSFIKVSKGRLGSAVLCCAGAYDESQSHVVRI